MDKIRDKTNKFINDHNDKKNRLSKNVLKDAQGNIDIDAYLSCKCCSHCHKVFMNSKFLIRHIFRRHSDEVVLLYENLSNRGSKNVSVELQHMASILREEFSSLKQELVKQRTEQHFVENEAPNKETINVTTEINRNSINDVISGDVGILKEKVIDMEKNIQNLNEKLEESDHVIKDEILMRQDITEKLELIERRILESQASQFIELRKKLLSDLKSLLDNQQQKNDSEWKSHVLELKRGIKHLGYTIDSIKHQPNFHGDSLKKEITDVVMSVIAPNISENCRRRRHRSLSSPNMTQSPKQKQISKHKKPGKEESISKAFNVDSEITHEVSSKVESMVAERLKHFSISPETFKLSSSEYDEKSKLISAEKQRLLKIYPNFGGKYDEIDKLADQERLRNLKSKKKPRVNFSEPLISGQYYLNCSAESPEANMHESLPTQNTSKEVANAKNPNLFLSKFMSRKGIHTVSDKGDVTFHDACASGDSIQQLTNKESIHFEHAEMSSGSETDEPVFNEYTNNLEDLNPKFPKSGIKVTTQNLKHSGKLNPVLSQKQQSFNSFPKVSMQAKEMLTSEKLSKVDNSKFHNTSKDDEFDDVSSLDSYKSSDN